VKETKDRFANLLIVCIARQTRVLEKAKAYTIIGLGILLTELDQISGRIY